MIYEQLIKIYYIFKNDFIILMNHAPESVMLSNIFFLFYISLILFNVFIYFLILNFTNTILK